MTMTFMSLDGTAPLDDVNATVLEMEPNAIRGSGELAVVVQELGPSAVGHPVLTECGIAEITYGHAKTEWGETAFHGHGEEVLQHSHPAVCT